MDLAAMRLSEKALEGVGWMVTPEQWVRPEPGADYIYADTNRDLGLEAPCSSGVLECAPRPKDLRRMERPGLHHGARSVALDPLPCG
jgi:hypothetical protein